LPPFPPVVRAGLFDVNVLAGLATPDGHQRVPMVRRRNRDRVDGFIVEELPHVDEGLVLRQALLLHPLEALGQHVFIHVAERRDFSLWNLREFLHMVPTAPTNAANSHADAVARAKDSLRMSNESDPAERGQTRAG